MLREFIGHFVVAAQGIARFIVLVTGVHRRPPVPTPARLDLAAETQAYQALLEGHRADPDDDELYADLGKARAAMEQAWLESTPTQEA